MHDLFVGTLDHAAANPIPQAQVLVIAHAPGIVAVIADQRMQRLAQLRRLRPQPLQADNHLFHLARSQVFGNLVDPAVGLLRSFAIAQPGKRPGP